MNISTTAKIATAATALVLADRFDQKYQISNDLVLFKRLFPMKFEVQAAFKGKWNIIDGIWYKTLRKCPNKTCIIDATPGSNRSMTYLDVEKYSNKIAHWVIAAGIPVGEVAGIFLTNRIEYIPVWLGFAKAGVTIAFLNSHITGPGLEHSIRISTAKWVIFGSDTSAAVADILKGSRLADSGVQFASIDCDIPGTKHVDKHFGPLSHEASPISRRASLEGSSNWGLVYTSGTTGLPKAAVIRHARFLAAASAFGRTFCFRETDILYMVLPLYHSAGGMIGVGMVLRDGATIVQRSRFSAAAFSRDLVQYKCTVVQYIGELCRYLLAAAPAPEDRQHRVRLAFGNGLRPDVWPQFQARFGIPEIGEFYASTEGNANMFVHTTGGPTARGTGSVGHIGVLMRHANPIRFIRICQETEVPLRGPDGLCIECDNGEIGECVGRINPDDALKSFGGYYKDQKANSQKILRDVLKHGDSWFRTGDLMKRDTDGYIYFIDRLGDTFRWKGENVSTGEVAAVVAAVPGVLDACVYGVALPGHEGRCGAVVIVVPPGTPEDHQRVLRDVAKHVCQTLPSFARPQFARVAVEVEQTGTFKHRKADLRAQGADPATLPPGEAMYILNHEKAEYHPHCVESFGRILSGAIRL
ncbi:hypothetical protein H696_02448 [Fonticula alba]|uniref:AMP-dependent synthetase/ligase domain-containing protein n=1 Tax=Fonticula alba TaxID=691883 RepID=A0A058ZAT4_FONAL|nr:hypothetical protein H696_02448 [Fonticula alba]KCV71504.1 hypothetical protein H696_02448 [Fonticula alba]|eukprot:XP_009494627.1 hypothetical protein H696_02448 [Fonticula alba]